MARSSQPADSQSPSQQTPTGDPPPEDVSPPDDASGGGGDGDGSGVVSPSPAAVAGADEEQGERTPPPAARPSAPPGGDWRDKRIAQLTAQLKARREADATAGKPAEPPASSPAPAPTSAGEVERRAQELSAQQEFLRHCDEMQQKGRSDFGQADFDGRTAALRQLIDPNDVSEATAWNSLLIAARETGDGPRLLYELGADLNTAQRLLGLPPVRMAVELTKMAAQNRRDTGDGGGASALPAPLRPVGARGPSHQAIEPDDPERSGQLTLATWMARRNAQVKARGLR